jgi:hypothetical protein
MPRLGLIGLSEAEKNLVRSALQLLATRVRTQWELTDHPPCDVLLTATAGVSGGYELQRLSQAGHPYSEVATTLRLERPLRVMPLLEILQSMEAKLPQTARSLGSSKRTGGDIGMAAARGWGDVAWHSMSGSAAKSLYVENKPRVILLPQHRAIHFSGCGADLAVLLKTSVPQLSRDNDHPSTLLFSNHHQHDWFRVFWLFGTATPSQYSLPGVNQGTVIKLAQWRDFSRLPYRAEYLVAIELLGREAMTIGRLQSSINMPITEFMPMVTALLLSGAAQVRPAVAETEQVFIKSSSFFKRVRKQFARNLPLVPPSSHRTV